MPSTRNVLFIVVDQMRADCLFGALGAAVDLPNMRGLMGESVSFLNHFSVCAPCGPSRVSLLTGQYAMNHRAVRNGTPLRHDTPNLASELRRSGRDPRLYGYTDTAQDPRVLPAGDPRLRTYEEVMPGFTEVVRMRLEDDNGPWRAHLKARGYDLPGYPDMYRPDGETLNAPAKYRAEDSDTAFLADAFLNDLAILTPGWVAHVTFIRPHPPFVAPAPFNTVVDPASVPAPDLSGPLDHPYMAPLRASKGIATVVEGFDGLEDTPENVAAIRATYLGLAAEVDSHLGRIFDALRTSGQYDDTLIVFTSDHGELLGDHGAWGKSSFHDAAFHTPLIIRDPDHPSAHGTRVDAFTESVDVTPTILDHLGLDVPHSMDGHSLRAFLAGEAPREWRSHSFSELDFGNPIAPTQWQRDLNLPANQANLAVLRTSEHRLVQFAADLPPLLFDMKTDAEARDVSDVSGNERICLDLSRKMLCHRMRHAEGTFARTMVGPRGVEVA